MSERRGFRYLIVGAALFTAGLLSSIFVQTDTQPEPQTRQQIDTQPKPQARQQTAAPLQARASIHPTIQSELEVCFRCHGAGGVSQRPDYPTLAGQKREYLKQQLQAFRHITKELPANEVGDHFDTYRGSLPQRSAVAMNGMAQSVPPHLIEPLAQALSSLACDGGKPKVKPLNPPKMPRKVVRCIVCHGQDGVSLQPNIPNLGGQQRAYIRRELMLIRDSAQGITPLEGATWRSHPTMETQAYGLTDRDIDEISDYFSALDCNGAAGARTSALSQ